MGEERDKNSLEEEPNQSLGDATESVETGPKYVLTEWLNEDLFKIGGMELVQVSHFFDGLICDLGCEDSPLFENKEVREDLLERLTEFSYYVNEEIKYMKTTLKGNEQYAKFSKDWVGHLTKAAYYAFFIHYGAKRKAEKDVNTQEPRDYVHHVMRSGFNCLIRKMRFFDEKTLLLCILHDTREDFDKGFLGLVHMDEEIKPGEYSSKDFQKRFKSARTKTVEKKDKIFDAFSRMENDLDRFSNKRELSLSKLVILMTKTTGDRNEAIVDLFYGIMSIEDPYERFSAFRAVMGKIADRLDNIKSLVVNLGKENEIVHAKEEIISDETWYLFLSLAKIFKMTNVAEWFYEYFYFKDLGERERRGEERATAHFVMRKKVTEKMGERRVEDYLLGDDSSGPEVEYDPNNPNDAAMLWEKNVGIYESNFYGHEMDEGEWWGDGEDDGDVIDDIESTDAEMLRHMGVDKEGVLPWVMYMENNEENLLVQFKIEFYLRLNAEFYGVEYNSEDLESYMKNPDEFLASNEGRSGILSLREAGMRFESVESVEALKDNDEYYRSILHYIIFHPASRFDKKTRKIKVEKNEWVECAKKVFKKMFPESLTKSSSAEGRKSLVQKKLIRKQAKRQDLETELVRTLLANNPDPNFEENNYNSGDYGVGLWSVFNSCREAIDALLGKFHISFFYKDKDATETKESILQYFDVLKEEIERLKKCYDEISLPADEIERISKGLFSDYTDDQRDKIRGILGKILRGLFMQRRKEPIIVSVNGKESNVYLPEDDECYMGTALLYANPLLLGKKSKTEIDWNDPVNKYLIDGKLTIEIDEEGEFDEALCDKQTLQFTEIYLCEFKSDLTEGNIPDEENCRL